MVSRFFRNYSWAVVMLGVAYLIDWKTGYEVSVFPLYAFPIAYAAYHGGLAGGLVFAELRGARLPLRVTAMPFVPNTYKR